MKLKLLVKWCAWAFLVAAISGAAALCLYVVYCAMFTPNFVGVAELGGYAFAVFCAFVVAMLAVMVHELFP